MNKRHLCLLFFLFFSAGHLVTVAHVYQAQGEELVTVATFLWQPGLHPGSGIGGREDNQCVCVCVTECEKCLCSLTLPQNAAIV